MIPRQTLDPIFALYIDKLLRNARTTAMQKLLIAIEVAAHQQVAAS